MCGTSTVGQTFAKPMTSASTNTTQVAGAKGDVPTQGGGGSDIAAMLAEIAKSIEALRQALAGSSSVAGASGNGGASGADTTAGGADAKAGAGGCGMSGCGGGGVVQQDGTSSEGTGSSNGSHGSHGSHGSTGTDSDVAGTGDTVAPGKPDVDGDSGDVTQQDPVAKAQAELDAAKAAATEKQAAVKAAKDAVADKRDAVSTAQKAVKDADTAKVAADKAVREARAELSEARASGGRHRVADGDTFASIAAKYDTTVAKLKAANPNVTEASGGKLHVGTVLKLPAGVGNEAKVAAAVQKLEVAKTEAAKAGKAVTAAIAALEAAKAVLEAAKQAVTAAKEAAKKAQEAVVAAQKALDEAKAAAGADAPGSTEQAGSDPAAAAHDARKAEMLDKLKAAEGKSFEARNEIFHGYFDAEKNEGRRKDLFLAFMGTLSQSEQERVSKFLEGVANASS